MHEKQPVTIIAEAGVNHCGSLDMALRLVDAAAEAGADYVKFQTFKAEALVSASAPLARYQSGNLGGEADTQLRMLRALQLSEADHRAIIEHCRLRSVKFLSTAFDLDSVEFLAGLSMDFWKIPRVCGQQYRGEPGREYRPRHSGGRRMPRAPSPHAARHIRRQSIAQTSILITKKTICTKNSPLRS